VAEFFSFLPLNPHSETECSIINIKVPNSSAVWPDFPSEVMAAALGYLVHMLHIITTYLDVCIPYSMAFFGSRSIIWREGSLRRYVLYNNNTNPQEFRTALDMLNWNVIHLCISQGISVDVEKYEQPLLNLLDVLRSPDLGSVAPNRTSSSDPHSSEHKKGRKRTVSISSIIMPSVSTSTIKKEDLHSSKEEQQEQPTKEESKQQDDEDEWTVINSLTPVSSKSNIEPVTSEQTMFVDKL